MRAESRAKLRKIAATRSSEKSPFKARRSVGNHLTDKKVKKPFKGPDCPRNRERSRLKVKKPRRKPFKVCNEMEKKMLFTS